MIYRPREEWIVVKNKHEPVISKEDYEKVQEILKSRNYERKPTTNLSIYYGKIKCADCGSGMCKMEDFRGNRVSSNYYCRNYKTTSSNCSPHKIRTADLNRLVLETIILQIKMVLNMEKTIEKAKNGGVLKELEQKYVSSINRLNNDIEKYKRLKKSVYEDWKLDNISKEDYLLYVGDYDKILII